MRSIRISRTFNEELVALLEQGVLLFGARVVMQKSDLVFWTIEHLLALYPVRPADPVLSICAYPVTRTPFVILYDYDDTELRIHLIIHGAADRTQVDLKKVTW